MNWVWARISIDTVSCSVVRFYRVLSLLAIVFPALNLFVGSVLFLSHCECKKASLVWLYVFQCYVGVHWLNVASRENFHYTERTRSAHFLIISNEINPVLFLVHIAWLLLSKLIKFGFVVHVKQLYRHISLKSDRLDPLNSMPTNNLNIYPTNTNTQFPIYSRIPNNVLLFWPSLVDLIECELRYY